MENEKDNYKRFNRLSQSSRNLEICLKREKNKLFLLSHFPKKVTLPHHLCFFPGRSSKILIGSKNHKISLL